MEEQFLGTLAQAVIAQMGSTYPELKRGQENILNTIAAEEMRFDQTLNVGLNLLDGFVEETKSNGKDSISGKDIFKLYDTYGFPKELTAEIAAENGLSVDLEGFEAEMERQRGRARIVPGKTSFTGTGKLQVLPTLFIGYKSLRRDTQVTALTVDGKAIESVEQGQEVVVYLSETPFYGEMGGQVGDTGEITGPRGRFAVINSISPIPNVIIHQGNVVEGEISVGDTVKAHVNRERRQDIARNHTATHLLQSALREVLGGHVRQSGSLVDPDHLRFDFAHPSAVTEEELSQIQHKVNEKIRQNFKVTASNMPYQQALDRGALAFFEEQYGDEVRVLEIGKPPISTELCGGTHVKATGEIGYFHVVDESSIGAGLRRIEAVTGRGAESYIDMQLSIIDEVAEDRLSLGD